MITCERCIHWKTQDDISGRCGLPWAITPGDAWCNEADDGEENEDADWQRRCKKGNL